MWGRGSTYNQALDVTNFEFEITTLVHRLPTYRSYSAISTVVIFGLHMVLAMLKNERCVRRLSRSFRTM